MPDQQTVERVLQDREDKPSAAPRNEVLRAQAALFPEPSPLSRTSAPGPDTEDAPPARPARAKGTKKKATRSKAPARKAKSATGKAPAREAKSATGAKKKTSSRAVVRAAAGPARKASAKKAPAKKAASTRRATASRTPRTARTKKT